MEQNRRRYEFGRHGTFHLREGWLSKGIHAVDSSEGFDISIECANRLGLGSRMVRSLAFWLDATRLTENTAKGNRKTQLTDFGKKVLELDPYFEFPITLWLVHIHLAIRSGTVWNWFFNDFMRSSFTRETCIEGFVRHTRENASNPAVLNTCQKEVSCLLNLYARPSGAEIVDPEDSTISPFRFLGLLDRNYDTATFEKSTPMDRIPTEAFLSIVSKMQDEGEDVSIKLSELVAGRNSPGRIMNLDSELVSEISESASNSYSKEGINLDLQGSERILTFSTQPSEYWLERHFEELGLKKS